jgi:hypothetical protein
MIRKKRPSAKFRLPLPLPSIPDKEETFSPQRAIQEATPIEKDRLDPNALKLQVPLKSPRILELATKKEKSPHRHRVRSHFSSLLPSQTWYPLFVIILQSV